jgi:hypothetical protein
MVPVSSSNVAAIGYDPGDAGVPMHGVSLDRRAAAPTVGDLYVQFRNGSLYVYRGVEESVYDDMFSAASPGRFVWRELRDRYPYERLS